MELLVNICFAWISVVLSILLCIIYIIRKLKTNNIKIKKTNQFLRKNHKFYGIALIIAGFLHGYFSSFNIISLNKGTVLWIISILLGINFYMRKKIRMKKSWIYYHRILSLFFIIILLLHIVEVGGFVGFKSIYISVRRDLGYKVEDSNNQLIKTDYSEYSNNLYKDGTYIGEADGYGPGLIAKVVIENNKITNIEVIEHNERNSIFYEEPIEVIPKRIIESQSPIVDVVAGSTMTSKGIMNAVSDALNQALISGNIKSIENQEKIEDNRKGNGYRHGKKEQ